MNLKQKNNTITEFLRKKLKKPNYNFFMNVLNLNFKISFYF